MLAIKYPAMLHIAVEQIEIRLTGAAWVCRPDLNWKCLPVGEAPPKVPLNDWATPPPEAGPAVAAPRPAATAPDVHPGANPFDQFDVPAKAPLGH